MPDKPQQVTVKNRSFPRYFYAGMNSFLEDVFKAFNNDIFKKHLTKRLVKEIKKGCLNVTGYRHHGNVVCPFSYMVLISNISEKSVFVNMTYAEGTTEDHLETSFEVPFDDFSIEYMVSAIKEKFFPD